MGNGRIDSRQMTIGDLAPLPFVSLRLCCSERSASAGRVRLAAQKRTGKEDAMSSDLMWNLIGLLGFIGLIGLLPQHEDDSYHPSSFDD